MSIRTVFALAFFAALALAPLQARAEAEFCGAQVRQLTPVTMPSGSTAAVYGFALRALSDRSVQGWIVADTDHGWFSWAFPKTKLNFVPDHLNVRGIQVNGKDFESDTLYVAFPAGTRVKHAWVEHVQTFGETVFGWDKLGQTTCEVPDLADVDPRGPLTLPRTPPVPSAIITAIATDPRFSATCATPFTKTGVADVPSLEVPQDFSGPMKATTVVEVLVKGDGSVLDAWLLGSSGNTRGDNEARIAAHDAKYTPSTAYCAPAETTYYFTASFGQ